MIREKGKGRLNYGQLIEGNWKLFDQWRNYLEENGITIETDQKWTELTDDNDKADKDNGGPFRRSPEHYQWGGDCNEHGFTVNH